MHILLTKQDHSKQRNKMSSITNKKQDLKQSRYFFSLNIKVSVLWMITYQFNKETVKSGLKRKRKPRLLLVQRKVKRKVKGD